MAQDLNAFARARGFRNYEQMAGFYRLRAAGPRPGMGQGSGVPVQPNMPVGGNNVLQALATGAALQGWAPFRLIHGVGQRYRQATGF